MTRRHLPLLVLSLLCAALGSSLLVRPSQADPAAAHVMYVSISGDGPTAKAWFAGSSPVGVPVQDALSTLSAQGYRVKAMVAGERPVVVTQGATAPLAPERTYVILLER